MSKQSAVQSKRSSAPGLTRSPANLSERRNTLGPHLCVQREAAGPAIHASAPALVREVVQSPGRPLDLATRASMEPRFGYDLSQVRVHTDERAAGSARAVNANAYTSGAHLVFAEGQYAPSTPQGRNLLAHELTHTIQQASGPVAGIPVGGGLFVNRPGDPFERAAGTTARRLTSGFLPIDQRTAQFPRPASRAGGGPNYVQRDTAGDVGAVAGVAGAVLGLGALIVGLLQLKAARQTPAQPTGGLSLTNVQFGPFNAAQPAAAGSSPAPTSPAPASTELPLRNDILSLSASEDSSATVGLMLRTDGHNILEGYTQEQSVQGYGGGSTGDNANITIRGSQITGSDPTIAEAALLVDGINTHEDQIQRFAGRIRARGNGNVVCDEAHKTTGPGTVDRSDSPPYMVVRLQPPAARASSSDNLSAPEEKGGLHPEQLLPFGRPMT